MRYYVPKINSPFQKPPPEPLGANFRSSSAEQGQFLSWPHSSSRHPKPLKFIPIPAYANIKRNNVSRATIMMNREYDASSQEKIAEATSVPKHSAEERKKSMTEELGKYAEMEAATVKTLKTGGKPKIFQKSMKSTEIASGSLQNVDKLKISNESPEWEGNTSWNAGTIRLRRLNREERRLRSGDETSNFFKLLRKQDESLEALRNFALGKDDEVADVEEESETKDKIF